MRMKPSRLATAAALAASISMAATPAAALDLPLAPAATVPVVDAGAVAAHSRRYRDRDRGIDAGDVVAGVLVLGAIAAIAGAFDGDRDRDQPRRQRVDMRERGTDGRGLGRAVDMCVAEIERTGERIASIEEATRDASGWRVSGIGENGERFECRIGNDGRIRSLERGGGYASSAPRDRQYSESVYARLRTGQHDYDNAPYDDRASEDYDAAQRPAYPGGPLPGEEGYDDYAGNYDPVG